MPKKIDWYYRRNGCRTCQRSDNYLAEEKCSIGQQLDARKERIGPAEAVRLARATSQLWVTRGKSVLHFDMKKDPPTDAELKKLLIGPSGNLRAPTIRLGRKMFVGFHLDAYGDCLGP